MPAKSRKQQRFFGMVRQCQKTGSCPSKEVRKVSKSIKHKGAKDFASTKHKGLPEIKKPKKKKKRKMLKENNYPTFIKWLTKRSNYGE